MKTWATLLLIGMVILYAVARSFQEEHAAWHWVRAFAEAGMIGALADWFAVVALFRHPMGLPIPHTAIVQRKKGRIGARLGRFVRSNFLSADVLQEQLVKHQVIPQAMKWLTVPENSQKVTTFLGGYLIKMIQDVDAMNLSSRVSKHLCHKLTEKPLEKGVGRWMEETMHGAEFRQVIAPIFAKLAVGIQDQREWVEEEAGQRAPLSSSKILSRLTKGVTKAFSGHAVTQVSEQLREASEDYEHPLYMKLEQSLAELAQELQEGGVKNEWANWRKKILSSERTESTVAVLLQQASGMLVSEKDTITGEMEQGISQMAQRVLDNPEELQRWEYSLFTIVENASEKYGVVFEKLIENRVQAWDASALSDTIEKSVGADLQYIRINGSLIGGVIGLLLHGIGLLIWAG